MAFALIWWKTKKKQAATSSAALQDNKRPAQPMQPIYGQPVEMPDSAGHHSTSAPPSASPSPGELASVPRAGELAAGGWEARWSFLTAWYGATNLFCTENLFDISER